ncbi:DUF3168 domain-containing protein [Roseovarius mucosus]|uniref:DUF3168 domain-containing protein n=1 Tax=Roseovarius mucosus TaxID=215743 RepID=UPI001C5CE8F2|nr:DUF3168 domain-containing protein [Roseovarius mucosus]MBW4972483.1 DUF3168 domain-containing protein [Roseovarius mucosus]
MSYAMAAGLQAAVYHRLVQDVALSALVGGAIHDALPPGRVPPLYVMLGPEEVRARGDGSAGGAWHRFTVTVVSESGGFQEAKAVAGAVSDALLDADLTLSRGRVSGLNFLRARARRETAGQARRIELTFQARVDDGA